MSEYIVSARKYRPMTFDSVVGQSALTTTLKNAVSSGKLAHAYLFCGPRGVGKTTCARIFAKVINCLTPTATNDACGECESCKAFNEGRSLNIFELDAASNNGVEQIKALMDQTRIPPQTGRYKVFIIDEVHMLSSQAFNAFLKTLEEPPAHVIFILATTEKHKILPTIISRCQIYDFERMSIQGIIGHLKNVADKEGITYEEEALNIIAEKADGGMRDALSIFDQAASFCQGNITFQKVIEDLNVLDADNYFRIIDLALENKVSEIMVILNGILSHGFDAGHMANGLASHIRNVMMATTPQTTELIEASDAMRQRYAEQAQKCPQKFLYQALKLLNQCDINYRQSSNKRLLVELTLIQVAQVTQEEDGENAGRGPAKRLKSLFKKILPQIQSAMAAQVAKTEHSSGNDTAGNMQPAATTQQSNDSNTHTRQDTTALQAQSVAKRPEMPKISMSNLGVSFGNIMKKPTVKKYDEDVPQLGDAANQAKEFTDDDVRREWLAMCQRMMQNPQFKVLGNRMLNVQVSISEFPNIVGICENSHLLTDVQDIRMRIQNTLAKYLCNGNVHLTLELGETKSTVKRLPPHEFLEQLVTASPAFAKFKDELKLELE